MSINFKFLFQQTGKLILYYIMELKGFYYQLPFNKNRVFSIKILPEYSIRYAAKGDIAQIIYKNQTLVKYKKSFEYSTLELFSALIKKGDVILDVGANSGLYSIFYSKLTGAEGKIYAFEPDPGTHSMLKKNLELNNCSNVKIYDFALSDKESKIEMMSYSIEEINLKENDSFKYIKEVPADKITTGAGYISAYRLDDIEEFRNLPRIDIIKIDVEGAELLVMEGSRKTILKYKPVIIFELSGRWTARFNYKPFQVLMLLNNLGYEMEEYEFQQWIARPAAGKPVM